MGIAVFAYSIGRGLATALLPVFAVQGLGWTDTHYSQIFASATIISGILGMFVAGALIDFFGKIRMMTIYLFVLIVCISVFAFAGSYWNNNSVVYGFFV